LIRLYSIHIPKTGGRSFDAVLKGEYGEPQVFNMTRDILRKTSKKLEETLPEKFSVLHGHLRFQDLLPVYQKQPAPVVTWLRDPVERVISNYYFLMERIQAGARPNQEHKRNESLRDHIHNRDAQNIMTKFLDGIRPEEMLFIGILEHFEEDLRYLGRLLQWKPVPAPFLNSNRQFRTQFPSVSSELREEIRRLNGEDQALYDEALRLRRLRRRSAGKFFTRILEWAKR